jgi:DNA transformation protein and related proteins
VPSRSEFVDAILNRLNLIGPVSARAMFGGYGLYMDGIMFGLIAYDTLYFKVDDGNRDDYIAAGAEPFTYEGKYKPIQMSYHRVPDEVFNHLEQLEAWVQKSHAAARRAKANTKPKKRQRRSTS